MRPFVPGQRDRLAAGADFPDEPYTGGLQEIAQPRTHEQQIAHQEHANAATCAKVAFRPVITAPDQRSVGYFRYRYFN